MLNKIIIYCCYLFQICTICLYSLSTTLFAMIQTSTSFIGIIIGTYVRSEMVLRLSVGLLEDYKSKYKMIMLIPALSSGCVSLFRIIFNNGIGFLIEKTCQVNELFTSRLCFMLIYFYRLFALLLQEFLLAIVNSVNK